MANRAGACWWGLIIFATVSVISFRLPAIAQEDTRAVGTVSIESTQPGELAVSWDAPTETPRDYRISWARADQDYPSREDSSANAFPTDTSYTITGLDEGVRYKVRVRARYDGSSGPFSAPVEVVIASAPTPTSTPVPTITATTVSCGDNYCNTNRHAYAATAAGAGPTTHSHIDSYIYADSHPDSRADVGTGSAGSRERRRTELDRCAGRSPLRTVGVGQRQRLAADWRKHALPARPTRIRTLPLGRPTSTPSAQWTPAANKAHGRRISP